MVERETGAEHGIDVRRWAELLLHALHVREIHALLRGDEAIELNHADRAGNGGEGALEDRIGRHLPDERLERLGEFSHRRFIGPPGLGLLQFLEPG